MAKKTDRKAIVRGQCVQLRNGMYDEILVVEGQVTKTPNPIYSGTMLSTGQKATLLCFSNRHGRFHLQRPRHGVVHFQVMRLRPTYTVQRHIVERRQVLADNATQAETAARAARTIALQFEENSAKFLDIIGR